jgi:predicted MPP superfamily phosphohydrolase
LIKPKDFSKLTHFPGETGNPLDNALFAIEKIEKIPAFIFFFMLMALAFIRFWYDLSLALLLFFFMIGDWVLIRSLPVFKRSFGPAKPVVSILVILRLIFSFLPTPWMVILQMVGELLVIYGFWIEPFSIKISRQKMAVENPEPKIRPLRLLHLSDLHIERAGFREAQLNKMVLDLAPDIILFSGDFLNLSYNRDPQAIKDAHEIIQKWQAPLGVYLVSGSPAVDFPDVDHQILDGLPVRWLQNEKVSLSFEGKPFEVIGVTCSQRPHVDTPILKKLIEKTNPFSILLYHSPDLAPEAANLGINLQLSGHTHGGQVRLPVLGALVTGSLYGKLLEAGRYQLNKMVLYVSRGIGLEGAGAPRVRFLCPPEIILWEISL